MPSIDLDRPRVKKVPLPGPTIQPSAGLEGGGSSAGVTALQPPEMSSRGGGSMPTIPSGNFTFAERLSAVRRIGAKLGIGSLEGTTPLRDTISNAAMRPMRTIQRAFNRQKTPKPVAKLPKTAKHFPAEMEPAKAVAASAVAASKLPL